MAEGIFSPEKFISFSTSITSANNLDEGIVALHNRLHSLFPNNVVNGIAFITGVDSFFYIWYQDRLFIVIRGRLLSAYLDSSNNVKIYTFTGTLNTWISHNTTETMNGNRNIENE